MSVEDCSLEQYTMVLDIDSAAAQHNDDGSVLEVLEGQAAVFVNRGDSSQITATAELLNDRVHHANVLIGVAGVEALDGTTVYPTDDIGVAPLDDTSIIPPTVNPNFTPVAADEEDVIKLQLKCDLHFVGLYGHTNGRRCDRHPFYGATIELNDLVRLKRTVVTINVNGVNSVEEAIKIVKIEDGVEGCTVGFIPRTHMKLLKVRRSIDKVAIVAEIYTTSSNKYKRMTSKKNCGMAGINLVENIPIGE
jgi:hypothetical protein